MRCSGKALAKEDGKDSNLFTLRQRKAYSENTSFAGSRRYADVSSVFHYYSLYNIQSQPLTAVVASLSEVAIKYIRQTFLFYSFTGIFYTNHSVRVAAPQSETDDAVFRCETDGIVYKILEHIDQPLPVA